MRAFVFRVGVYDEKVFAVLHGCAWYVRAQFLIAVHGLVSRPMRAKRQARFFAGQKGPTTSCTRKGSAQRR